MKILALSLLLLCILTPLVFSTGISGGDLAPVIDFTPNMKYDFTFTGISDRSNSGLDYDVYARGSLAAYTTFDQTVWKSLKKDEQIAIVGHLSLPASLPPPAQDELVCFRNGCPGGGNICGTSAACVRITVRVPYDGIFPVISLAASNVNQDAIEHFVVNMHNDGKETVNHCSGSVDVYNIDRKKLGDAVLSNIDAIQSFGGGSMKADFDTNGLLPGNYFATAFVDCDSQKLESNASFRIGELKVIVVDYTKELEAGGLKRFTTNIESGWNDPLSTYVSVRIFDENTSVSGRSPTDVLDSWKRQNFDTALDTTSLQPKEYNVNIAVFYADKTTTAEGKVRIIAPASNMTSMQEIPKSGGFSTTTLTIILVIVVIMLTIFNVLLALYRKKKE